MELLFSSRYPVVKYVQSMYFLDMVDTRSSPYTGDIAVRDVNEPTALQKTHAMTQFLSAIRYIFHPLPKQCADDPNVRMIYESVWQ